MKIQFQQFINYIYCKENEPQFEIILKFPKYQLKNLMKRKTLTYISPVTVFRVLRRREV